VPYYQKTGYILQIIRKICGFLKSLMCGIWAFFEFRDVLVYGGLVMLGYGLHLKWGLWLGLMVCGIIMFILGLLWPVFLSLTAKRAK